MRTGGETPQNGGRRRLKAQNMGLPLGHLTGGAWQATRRRPLSNLAHDNVVGPAHEQRVVILPAQAAAIQVGAGAREMGGNRKRICNEYSAAAARQSCHVDTWPGPVDSPVLGSIDVGNALLRGGIKDFDAKIIRPRNEEASPLDGFDRSLAGMQLKGGVGAKFALKGR